MKLILATVLFTLLLTACSETTTYKAKPQGWNKVLEAKTISLAQADCSTHRGYYNSLQIEQWGGWDNNQYWYDSIKLTCNDGYIVVYPINIVEQHYSVTVADILTNKGKQ